MNPSILTSITTQRLAKNSASPNKNDAAEEEGLLDRRNNNKNVMREHHNMTPQSSSGSSRRLRDHNNNNNAVASHAHIFANHHPKTPVRKSRTVSNNSLQKQQQATARTPDTRITTSSRTLDEDPTESETYTHYNDGQHEDDKGHPIIVSNLHEMIIRQTGRASSSSYPRKSSSFLNEDMAEKRDASCSPRVILNEDHHVDRQRIAHDHKTPQKVVTAVGATTKNQQVNEQQQQQRRGRAKVIGKLPQSLSVPNLDGSNSSISSSSSNACESSSGNTTISSTTTQQQQQPQLANNKKAKIQQCVIYKRSSSVDTGIGFGTSHDNHIVINALDPENSLCANKGLTIGMRLVRVNDTVMTRDAVMDKTTGGQTKAKTAPPLDHTMVDQLVNRRLKGEVILHFREAPVSEPPGLPIVEYETGMQDLFGRAMSETRAILHARRKKGLGWQAKLRFRAKPPVWIRNHFDLYKDSQGLIYADHKKLRDYGRVVWACLVMANSTMFDPRGKNDANPAIALYSPDPFYDRNLGDLDAISRNLFRLKGDVYEDTELQEFSQILASESKDIMSYPVPKVLTGGRLVFYTTLIIHRKHLPVPYLADRTFPLLIAPRYTTAAMILPKEYWSEAAQSLWKA